MRECNIAYIAPPQRQTYAAYARGLLNTRRRIRDFFDPNLFGDPAFDIMLDLFVSAEEGADVSITSCCAAAQVPTTTALRWIGMLVDKGILVREPHPSDGRSVLVRLTPLAHTKMRTWLEASLPNGARGVLR